MTETNAIRYRVIDFLERYPPFQAMGEEDLLALVARGRVRFHEADEYVYWQGRPHGPFILVIQQGTVALWEDSDGQDKLRDIRGSGDLLAIDRLLGAENYLHSAKATSDVVLYALLAEDFEPLLQKYPSASRYLAAHASVSASYEVAGQKKGAHQTFVYEVVRDDPPLTCGLGDSVEDATRRMQEAGRAAIAVVDAEGRLLGVMTAEAVLGWIARGGADPRVPVTALLDRAPAVVSLDTTADQCVLVMAERGAAVIAVTETGALDGRLHALVTPQGIAPVFGEQPLQLLREAAHAPGVEALAALNKRARALVLEQLATPATVDWLSRLTSRIDGAILARVLDLFDVPRDPGSAGQVESAWFLFGACGRGESITALSPQIGFVFDPGPDDTAGTGARCVAGYRRVMQALAQCGFVPRPPLSDRDVDFRCAPLAEWEERFRCWVRDPVASHLYLARPMFDLRPAFGRSRLLERLEEIVCEEVALNDAFLRLLAHDCLANLPPLSFFRDLVVEETGEQDEVLHLERNALRPLVDVGRVFGIAAGRVFGTSSLDRFSAARVLLPEHDLVFRDAADTLRVMLYHQARSGLRQKDGGIELAPSGLSHHDRQVLKTGFRSILRMLEFTAECRWLEPS